MRIECPCGGSADENRTLQRGTFDWTCPECEREWEVRTVFFEHAEAHPDFGPTLKSLRTDEGMTQEQLGELVGVTAAYISHIEAGKRQPGPKVRRRLLAALDIRGPAAVD